MNALPPSFVGLGVGMVTRVLVVRAEDVVFVKGIVEASEGVAQVFAVHGGDLTLAAPADREVELDELLAELVHAVGGHTST